MNVNPTTTPRIAPKTVLATYASASKPGLRHEVRIGADHNVYCTCPAWRHQKVSPIGRECKHTRSAKATLLQAVVTRPVAVAKVVTETTVTETRTTVWERLIQS